MEGWFFFFLVLGRILSIFVLAAVRFFAAAPDGNGVLLAGITPLCYSLFALYDTQSRVWLPPNHLFKISKDTNLNLLFRMR